MKKIYLTAITAILCNLVFGQYFVPTNYRGAFAPSPATPWTDSWTNWDPQNTVYPEANVTITDNITSNTTWTADKVYLLSGQIYVKNNATLTIEPGTVILGDKAFAGCGLFVTKGAKLNAIGTAAKPIVFTSNQEVNAREEGDWGGIILLGKAATNLPDGIGNIEGIDPKDDTQYGGGLTPDTADNSGTLKYVRIEFAGQALKPDKEINGLTLGAVGNGTTIEYVQTSYVGDDGFEWFGGSVNCKYLVSFRNTDDDFDTDNGYSGKVQFGLAVRDASKYDAQVGKGTTSCFESDNDKDGTTATPQTSATFSNMTLIGPKRGESNPELNTSWRNGAHIRKNSALKIYNSIFTDFITGLHIDGVLCEENAKNGKLIFKNNVIANSNGKVVATSLVKVDTLFFPSAFTTVHTWFGEQMNDSIGSTENIFVTPYNFTAGDYRPLADTNTIAHKNVTHELTGGKGEEEETNGINELTQLSKITIYPNPVQNEATLQVSMNATSEVSVVVTDLSGKVVATVFNGNVNAGTTEFNINMANFTSGMYYTTIRTGNTVKTIKMSVSK